MRLAYRTCLSRSQTLAVPSWTTLSTGGENLSLPGFKGDDIAYGGTICCWYCVIANSSSIRGHCPLSQSCLGGFKIYSFIGVHLRVVQKLPLPIYLICRYLFSKIYKTINIYSAILSNTYIVFMKRSKFENNLSWFDQNSTFPVSSVEVFCKPFVLLYISCIM